MATATLAPGPVRPADPRVAREGELPPSLAKELVTRLARAVQRATIYPPSHPSVRLAVSPLIEVLRALPVAEVLVGFTSDRVYVGTGHRDAAPFALPWMSSRLSARGLSSLRISPRLSLEEAERLVVWLAGSDDLLAAGDLPVFDGAVAAKVDFAAVRFRDEPPEADAGSPADLAWQAVCRHMFEGWGEFGTGEGPLDPTDLASMVRDALDQREGTGVRDLTERIVGASAHLANLPESVQAAVKARLATFVTALSPELRGQLLSASPGDDPAKLGLLADLVDRLPNALVLEVMQGADLVRGSSSRQFVSFMLKLATMAANDPQLAEAFECRCSAAGLPPDLAFLEPSRLRGVLEDLLEARPDDAPMIAPEEYQQRLEQISATTIESAVGYDEQQHGSATDPAALAQHSARIALMLLEAEGSAPPDRVSCLDRLAAALPHGLASGDFELLGDIVEAAARLARDPEADASLAEKARATLAWFQEAGPVDAAIAALEDSDGDPATALVIVARAGGEALALSVIGTLVRAARSPAGHRLSRALAWLEPGVVRAAIADVHRHSPRQLRPLLAALAAAGVTSPAAEVAHLLLGADDPSARVEAYKVLFAAHAGTPRWEPVVRRALEDDDARILLPAVEEAAARAQAGVGLLAAFLDRRGTSVLAAAQHHAIRVLAAMETDAARDALRRGLASRGARFDGASRRIATAIAAALAAGGDERDQAAVRAWRRSPAGWITRLFGSGRAG